MCVAIPMKLINKLSETSGTGEIEGVQYQVDLSLVQPAEEGDYLIVHAGFAIEKLDQKEAQIRIALFKGMRNEVP